MSALAILGLAALMTATAFLSGIFGMAGGLVLIGVLLAIMPVPTAMALHAVTQMASNGWRALLWRRHIVWRQLGFLFSGMRRSAGRLVVRVLRPGQGCGTAMSRSNAVSCSGHACKSSPQSRAPSARIDLRFDLHVLDASYRV